MSPKLYVVPEENFDTKEMENLEWTEITPIDDVKLGHPYYEIHRIILATIAEIVMNRKKVSDAINVGEDKSD